MESIDYYTGQPNMTDDQQAAQYANFGQYLYSGNQVINPGAYQQQQQQPQYGLGGYNNFQYYNQMPNPAFYMMNSPNTMIQQPQQVLPQGDITYDIPGWSYGGEYLFPIDIEDRLYRMQNKIWNDSVDEEARREVENIKRNNQYNNAYGNPYYNGYNYYGNPYYNYYSYINYNPEVENEIKTILEEAKERRIQRNINLSKLAHSIIGDSEYYNDNVLEELYRGKTVTVPGISYNDVYEYNRFNNLVPFSNAQYYRDLDAAVSAEYNKYISPDADMNECFDNMGLVWCDYEREDEIHRRRQSAKNVYDSSGYKYLVMKRKMEKIANQEGVILPNASKSAVDQQVDIMQSKLDELKREALNMFPTLSSHARIAEDGTLHITYSEVNEDTNENKYKFNKDRFNSFLTAIPGVFIDNKERGDP